MRRKFFVWLACFIAAAATLGILTGCDSAEMQRARKDRESNYGGGLNREIVVYSATGEEVWKFTGKFDIDYDGERVLFDDEKDKRHVIYFRNGIIIVNEL